MSKKKNDFEGIGTLLYEQELLYPDGPENSSSNTVIEASIAGVSPTTGDNISYGNAIEVTADNIHQFGFGDDVVTYFMDENGNFSVNDDELGIGSDFAEASPEEFLAKFSTNGDGRYSIGKSPDGTVDVQGIEDQSFMLQRVEVDGYTQGYFIYNESDGMKHGFYLDTDAIQLDGLDEGLRNDLIMDNQPDTEINRDLPSPMVENSLDKFDPPNIKM